MAVFCVSCGCRVNSGDKFCFKCGAKVPDTSLSERGSTPEEEIASSPSSTKSLSQLLVSKAEERSGFSKPNKGFKRKASNMGSTSKRGIDNRVVIHVGLIRENEEGKLAIVRRSKVGFYGIKGVLFVSFIYFNQNSVFRFPCLKHKLFISTN